jgi:caa(3)-type oxidase subunit IV
MAHDTHADHSHGGDHSHHIIPMRKLVVTFALLIILMVATVLAARLPYEGGMVWLNKFPLVTNGIALTIAFIKAGLVVQIFMGVKFSTNTVKFYAYGGFIWAILIFMILLDYFSRPFEPVQGWEAEASTALPRDARRPDGMDPQFQITRPEHKEEHGGGH